MDVLIDAQLRTHSSKSLFIEMEDAFSVRPQMVWVLESYHSEIHTWRGSGCCGLLY